MRSRTILPVVLTLGLLSACSRKPSDQKIATDIQNSAYGNPIIQGSQIHVESHEGKVTLTGTAKTQAAKDELQKISHAEAGVVNVEDDTSLESTDVSFPLSAPSHDSGSQPAPAAVATQAAPVPPPPPPPPPKPFVIPVGTTVTIRTNQPLGSKTSRTGAVFTGSILTPISLEGEVAIPAGSEVTGIVKEAKQAGRIKGAAVLRLALESVTVAGHTYNVQADEVSQKSTGKGKRSAAVIGGGTGLGAVVGGIAGGGKGAAIGALTGAAAGTIGAATTGKRDIALPAEAAIPFRLNQPLTINRD